MSEEPHLLVHDVKDNVGVVVVEDLSAGTDMLCRVTEDNSTFRLTVLDDVPIDPWGNEFQYSFTDGDLKPQIWSMGPNAQDDGGSGDDISNRRRDQS